MDPDFAPVFRNIGNAKLMPLQPEARKIFFDTVKEVVDNPELYLFNSTQVKYASDVVCMFTSTGLLMKTHTTTSTRVVAFKRNAQSTPLICHEYDGDDKENGVFFTETPELSPFFLDQARKKWAKIDEKVASASTRISEVAIYFRCAFVVEPLVKGKSRYNGKLFEQAVASVVDPKTFRDTVMKEAPKPNWLYVFFTKKGAILVQHQNGAVVMNMFVRHLPLRYRFMMVMYRSGQAAVHNGTHPMDERLEKTLLTKWKHAEKCATENKLFVDKIHASHAISFLFPQNPVDVLEAEKDKDTEADLVSVFT